MWPCGSLVARAPSRFHRHILTYVCGRGERIIWSKRAELPRSRFHSQPRKRLLEAREARDNLDGPHADGHNTLDEIKDVARRVTGCWIPLGAASDGYESLMAGDAALGLSVEVIDVDGFAVRAERVELCPPLHPLDAALVVQLDLRDALRLRQIIE